MKVEEALAQLPVEKKARRLKILWPLIEAKLAEGVSHAVVLEFLNRNGFELTEGTYKSYLHRFRKLRRAPGRVEPRTPCIAPAPAMTPEGGNRPATFDYDPRGIPDLLK